MKTELDPFLISALQLCGQEQTVVSLIETLEKTQAAYRRRDIPKQRAVELTADVMAKVTNLGVVHRIGTRVLDESVGCTVFHPAVGAAIANRPLWTKQNLGRGVGIALDRLDFDIAAALVGRQQLPMYQWIAPDDVSGGFYDNMPLEDYIRVHTQPVASKFSFVSPLVDVSCFGMPVGMVYGGASDLQYPQPMYFSWRE